MKTATAAKPITLPTANRLDHACKKFWRSRYLLLMLLPALIWYIVFMYAPMYGAQIAFRDFSPVLGITGSKWVGFKYFIQFFKSEYFGRLIKNTLGISCIPLLWAFPFPSFWLCSSTKSAVNSSSAAYRPWCTCPTSSPPWSLSVF